MMMHSVVKPQSKLHIILGHFTGRKEEEKVYILKYCVV